MTRPQRTPRAKQVRTAPQSRRDELPWRSFGRVMVFIDVANLQQAIKDIRWKKFNYDGLMSFFKERTRLSDVRFYYGILPDHEGQKTFFKELEEMGYTLRVKKIKLIRQPDGTTLRKGNYDVDLAVDAMGLVDRYDTAVLFSGDSDFLALAQGIKERGKKIVVISSRRHTATELRTSATHYVDITSLDQYLKRLPPSRAREQKRTDILSAPLPTRKYISPKYSGARAARFSSYFMPPRKRLK